MRTAALSLLLALAGAVHPEDERVQALQSEVAEMGRVVQSTDSQLETLRARVNALAERKQETDARRQLQAVVAPTISNIVTASGRSAADRGGVYGCYSTSIMGQGDIYYCDRP